MDIKKFRELEGSQKVKLVNERIAQISNTKEFKCKELEFSYSSALAEMEHLGYERKGNEFVKTLTSKEIEVLQELAKHYNHLVSARYNLGAQIQESTDIKATTFKLDTGILKDWQEFCKVHSDFSAPGLLGAALRNFMQLYK